MAKATLYSTFGSKDELVRAYLEGRHSKIKAQLARELPVRYATARERLAGILEIRGETVSEPGFRGCAFVAASAEAGEGTAALQATTEYRAWFRGLLRDLAAEAGAADPDGLARPAAPALRRDGRHPWLDHDPAAACAAVWSPVRATGPLPLVLRTSPRTCRGGRHGRRGPHADRRRHPRLTGCGRREPGSRPSGGRYPAALPASGAANGERRSRRDCAASAR